jgi:hypothetical protein
MSQRNQNKDRPFNNNATKPILPDAEEGLPLDPRHVWVGEVGYLNYAKLCSLLVFYDRVDPHEGEKRDLNRRNKYLPYNNERYIHGIRQNWAIISGSAGSTIHSESSETRSRSFRTPQSPLSIYPTKSNSSSSRMAAFRANLRTL